MPDEDEMVGDTAFWRGFSHLTPARMVLPGVALYDKTSFPVKSARLQLPHPKYGGVLPPTVFMVDDLEVKVNRRQCMVGPQACLAVHGMSTKRYWRDIEPPNRDVEEIVAEIEAAGVPIDALMVCNPGRYELPEADGPPYIYVHGEGLATFTLRDGNLIGDFSHEDGAVIKFRKKDKPTPIVHPFFKRGY